MVSRQICTRNARLHRFRLTYRDVLSSVARVTFVWVLAIIDDVFFGFLEVGTFPYRTCALPPRAHGWRAIRSCRTWTRLLGERCWGRPAPGLMKHITMVGPADPIFRARGDETFSWAELGNESEGPECCAFLFVKAPCVPMGYYASTAKHQPITWPYDHRTCDANQRESLHNGYRCSLLLQTWVVITVVGLTLSYWAWTRCAQPAIS